MSCGKCQHWARDIAESYHSITLGLVALSTCRAPVPHSVESSGPTFAHSGEGCPCFKDAGTTFVPTQPERAEAIEA